MPKDLSRGWKKFSGEARTRILFWYVLIIVFIFTASIPAFRLLLYSRVDERVRRELRKEMEAFTVLVNGESIPDQAQRNPENIKESETEESETTLLVDKRFKRPSSKQDLKKIFDAFLSHRLPEDENYLIAILDGEFYRSSPRGRPKPLGKNSELMRRWAKQTRPEQGEKQIPDPAIESIIYLTEPVKINGKTLGVFVAAHTIADERAEALQAVMVVVQVSCFVLVVALMLAWVASGRVLTPLRVLIATTRSIGESDLQQRIPFQGQGEIAELATTFNEMMDRLQAAFISQRNFINDAGNELRTPITIIRGYLESMGDNPQEVQSTLALVLDELNRMSQFVEALILLAKIESPDFLLLETVDVSFLTEELFAKAKVLAQRNWLLDATAKGQIVIDRQRLIQAVINLAKNATQRTQNIDTIAIGSAITNTRVSFWVRDTGESIAFADQQKIFESFARVANSRSDGASLGLSIVKAITSAHSGEVILHSQPGLGSKFTIILPIISRR